MCVCERIVSTEQVNMSGCNVCMLRKLCVFNSACFLGLCVCV